MKSLICLIFFLSVYFCVSAQTIRTSKNTINFDKNYAPVIVGTFKGVLHTITRSASGDIEIHLHDDDLNSLGKKVLVNNSGKEFVRVQLIRFHSYYYTVLVNRRREKSRIFQIKASGELEDKTAQAISQLAGTFPNYAHVAKYNTVQDRLIVSVTYYDSLQNKLYLQVQYLDSMLWKKNEYSTALDYNQEESVINNLIFVDTSNVVIMKSFKYFTERVGQVDIFKYTFSTGKAIKLTVASQDSLFFNPSLTYKEQDSGFFFLARVRTRSNRKLNPSATQYYCLKLNGEFEPSSDMGAIPLSFKNLEKTILVVDEFPLVINNSNFPRTQGTYRYAGTSPRSFLSDAGLYSNPSSMDIWSRSDIYSRRGSTQGYNFTDPYRVGNPIEIDMRVVVLGGKENKKEGTLLKSKKGKFRSEYLNSFLFNHPEGFTVFFTTHYSSKGTGISYIAIKKGKMADEEFLTVDQRYKFLLMNALRVSQHEFVVPYTYKDKVGFIKVSF